MKRPMMLVVLLLAMSPAWATPTAEGDDAKRHNAASEGGSTREREKRPYAYLGLRFRWGKSTTTQRFLHVDSVASGGPAERAGIEPDDVITHVNDLPVGFGDELDFLIFLRERTPGERLVLTTVRSGVTRKIVLTLATLPEHAVGAWNEGFRKAQQKRAARNRAEQPDT